MGSHLRVVRPGGLSRLRGWLQATLEVARARKELPRRALAAPQSFRALWGGRVSPAPRPLLPNSGRDAGLQRKNLL